MRNYFEIFLILFLLAIVIHNATQDNDYYKYHSRSIEMEDSIIKQSMKEIPYCDDLSLEEMYRTTCYTKKSANQIGDMAMPYTIKEQNGKFHIINAEGKTVGVSDAKDKAERSIGYREEAEKKKADTEGGVAR